MSQGAGPIWPGGKPPAGQPLKPAEEAFEMHKEVSAPGTNSTGAASKVSETSAQSQAQKAQEAAPTTQITKLSVKDILQQLANIKVPVNDHNQELALLMAAHGIEISEDSFGLINKLLKGKKSKAAKESAILLVSKGLGEAADDVGILNNLLSKNSQVSDSLKNLAQMQGKMMSMLNNAIKDHPGLHSFAALFDDFNEQLKKTKKISKSNQLLVNPSELMDDAMAMQAFLKGLGEKLNLNNKALAKYLSELGRLNENLMGQIILSQDSVKQPLGLLESFHYFQIPNPLSAQAVIEMLLRKQSRTKKGKDKRNVEDNEQEKIIISMDTETMGTITVIVVVMGFKVWCTIYSDKESAISHVNSFRSELSDNLQKYQYSLEEFKTSRKKINIQKFIAPSQDISEVKRIQTEI
ncbi:hypothetical protein DID73_02215 [Candidatus Marinamargulisbacteria bacterium SCGC AG-343-K17]|nr:hypothetical protein DID73_02215 [Candidatus Marinamargulisbacteria bacterium SCGC AG-343-K17]